LVVNASQFVSFIIYIDEASVDGVDGAQDLRRKEHSAFLNLVSRSTS